MVSSRSAQLCLPAGTERKVSPFLTPRAARRGQFAIRQPAWPVGRRPPGQSWSPSLTNGNCELSTCRGPWGSPLVYPGPGDQIKQRWLARAGDSSSCLIQNVHAVWHLWHRAFSVLAKDPHTSSSVTATALCRDPEADGADDNRRSQEPWSTMADTGIHFPSAQVLTVQSHIPSFTTSKRMH